MSITPRDAPTFIQNCCWPPPVDVEDPYPNGKYPDSKVWVWVPFPWLIPASIFCQDICPAIPLWGATSQQKCN